MSKEEDISVDYLMTRLRYEPETGKLFWLDNEDMPNNWRARFAGEEAFASVNGSGYKQGCILTKKFDAHRVAWALFYGKWPDQQIDHINGIKDDNRIENLRDVSTRENTANRKMPSNNRSGVVGVSWNKREKKWKVYVSYYGVRHVSTFACIGQAIKARREAEKLYGFHPNHGKR